MSMAVKTDKNVAGLYDGSAIDSIEVRLHSNDGWEVNFNIWEDQDGVYHVFSEEDEQVCEFLAGNYPSEYTKYRQMVDKIPTASSRYLSMINSFIASHTYNSIRPLIENEENWMELNEEELDRD